MKEFRHTVQTIHAMPSSFFYKLDRRPIVTQEFIDLLVDALFMYRLLLPRLWDETRQHIATILPQLSQRQRFKISMNANLNIDIDKIKAFLEMAQCELSAVILFGPRNPFSADVCKQKKSELMTLFSALESFIPRLNLFGVEPLSPLLIQQRILPRSISQILSDRGNGPRVSYHVRLPSGRTIPLTDRGEQYQV